MNARQFLAVIILFIGLVVFVLYQGNRKKEREKYELVINESIRVLVSSIKLKGPVGIMEAKERARLTGYYTIEERAAVDVLAELVQNGNVDKRSGVRIPEWLIKEYKKRYNANF